MYNFYIMAEEGKMRGITGFRAKINQVKPSIVFLVLAVLVGGYLRLTKGLSADFPLNDGGLFYQMTQELVENHFRLPVFTGYNHLNIPYAYPPLAFYLTGALSQIFGWSLLSIYRIFPAVVTVLTIPAFYLLAKDFIDDDNHLSLAVLIFALIPVTFDWTIMGGGVTRAPALLFSLLSLHFCYLVFVKQQRFAWLWGALTISVSILFHPETGFHTAVSLPVFWLFFARNKKGLVHTAIITGLTALFTAPWWATVILRHGFVPFTRAFLTAGQDGNSFFELFSFQLTNEKGLYSIAVLALIGLFLYLSKRDYFIPIWFLFSYAIAPRSARVFIAAGTALFASYALIMIFNWLDTRFSKGNRDSENPAFLSHIFSKILLGLLFFQWFSSASVVLQPFEYVRVTPADQEAFTWVASNTDTDSEFIVLSNYFWSSDPVSEWFPVLADRQSVATVQGTEWVNGVDFLTTVERASQLQSCHNQDVTCIDSWSSSFQTSFDHVYVRKLDLDRLENKNLVPIQSALATCLRNDPEYELLYESDSVAIFKKK
jgi:hypothetical protein